MLTIMKASAGSGKTYNLAKTYIGLLIKNADPHAYRHILAVTFTNKATDEMKSRILKELHILATRAEKSDYLAGLMKDNSMTREQVCKRAQTVLYNILHDYSAFAVSTIDKFFQQTLKAFSREIGQFASYQVELDRDSLIAESVDRVLDSLTEDSKDLLPWLTDNVLDQIQQGGRYNLETNLLDKALRLKAQQRMEAMKRLGMDPDAVCPKERLREIRKACRGVISTFNNNMKALADDALRILTAAGLKPEDTNRKFMTVLYDYQSLGNYDHAQAPKESFMKRALKPDEWFAKTKPSYLGSVYPDLAAPLEDICRMWSADSRLYHTAFVIDDQVYGLGVAAELDKAFKQLMKEKNVLCIDDSNTILRDIIDNSEAPFVYEKLGVRFDHFLLDEFQDTSSIQWDNFRALIQDSESKGGENLVVGDVKQSIYRWRGSDWKLLNETVPSMFSRHKPVTLQTNYRSLSTVVKFNNVFFKVAARILDKISGYEKAVGPIGRIYADVRQEVAPSKQGEGSVSMTFCPREDQLEQVRQAILKVVESGAKLSEIAILVRGNKSGQEIASYLIDNGIPVLTEEALKAKSALTVRRIVSLMSYVDNPDNTVNGFLARSLDVKIPDSSMSLIDMAEALLRELKRTDTSQAWRGEALHIQAFMDFLLDYVSSNGNDLRGFLRLWDEKNPSISSSPSGESIKVMTIHKSKGLDFPYVILPFVENIKLYKPDNHWCEPELQGTVLEESAAGLYDVTLSGASADTLFAKHYEKERFLQQVDNINTLYVAMTRASLGVHIIAKNPPASQIKAFSEMVLTGFTDFSQMLYWFADRTGMTRREEGASLTYSVGNIPDFNMYRKSALNDTMPLVVADGDEYPSVPLNFGPEDELADVCERGRLKFTSEALNFFKEDNEDMSSSRRVRGVVLHDILSRVIVPEDLEASLGRALHDGEIDPAQVDSVRELLSSAIDAGIGRGWFPSDRSRVINEAAILDVGGGEYRPDRVVLEGSRVIIIDYKFGEQNTRYARQVLKYADLWKRMGYKDVEAELWYVETGDVVKVL